MLFRAVVVVVFGAIVSAHPQVHVVGSAGGCNCTQKPTFKSYHIHTLFYADGKVPAFNDNVHNEAGAMELRSAFMEQFNVTLCATTSGLFNQSELCAFEVDNRPGYGNAVPFLTPNFAFYVPVHRYADTVPWMMQNRGSYDVLVHPNSCELTCAAQDHLEWPIWMGTKWQLRFPSSKKLVIV